MSRELALRVIVDDLTLSVIAARRQLTIVASIHSRLVQRRHDAFEGGQRPSLPLSAARQGIIERTEARRSEIERYVNALEHALYFYDQEQRADRGPGRIP